MIVADSKGTKVDGVYDSDPELNKNAVKYENLSYKKVIDNELMVMDLTAITLCKEMIYKCVGAYFILITPWNVVYKLH